MSLYLYESNICMVIVYSMSNLGLFSNCELIATDLSLNGHLTIAGDIMSSSTIHVIAATEDDRNTQTNTIEGILTTATIRQTNPIYAFFYYPYSTATITANSGYVFTSVDENDVIVGMRRVQFSPYNSVTLKNAASGLITIPFSGFYLITGQFCFNSNTAGNKWQLNVYRTNGSANPVENTILCCEPVSNTNSFIRTFHLTKSFFTGESFSISLTNYQGPDVLKFGLNCETSFLKVFMTS